MCEAIVSWTVIDKNGGILTNQHLHFKYRHKMIDSSHRPSCSQPLSRLATVFFCISTVDKRRFYNFEWILKWYIANRCRKFQWIRWCVQNSNWNSNAAYTHGSLSEVSINVGSQPCYIFMKHTMYQLSINATMFVHQIPWYITSSKGIYVL